ncbi:LytTR family DNA-binding domain-containing protein [Sporolactobacillus pectinivorans]|uniref:LytTR family DNA-binding domain-containing protein n=1 Tax=Sporolactobacillus pectinivorans TaxID=1591408 RepID=UPI000C2569FB|nr:LytTR family DNA-binding domain-containing protein [Sporolactobacillus pectinivorans]
MKLNIDIDPELLEEQVVMHIRRVTEKVERIRKIVETDESKGTIAVVRDDRQYILPLQQVSHLMTENGKIVAVSRKRKYFYKQSLKYFETHANSGRFIRISKYCLANIDWMDFFEAGFSGNLMLNFKNEWKETVSRKYVADLKKRLF